VGERNGPEIKVSLQNEIKQKVILPKEAGVFGNIKTKTKSGKY
jgi:hypothetical protein